MSNVIDITGAKAEKIDKWKPILEEQGDKLWARLHDQIRLADIDMDYDGVPEDIADSMVLGVIISLLVMICSSRNVLSPDVLPRLVKNVVREYNKNDAGTAD